MIAEKEVAQRLKTTGVVQRDECEEFDHDLVKEEFP